MSQTRSKFWLIVAPFAWLTAFFLVPFGIVAKISLSDAAIARPPYIPTFDWASGVSQWWEAALEFDFENFVWLTEEALYWKSYVSSLEIAFLSTLLTLAVGFPIAYAMSRTRRKWRPLFVMLIILPFWTSFLIRVYAWIGILKKEGLLNLALES